MRMHTFWDGVFSQVSLSQKMIWGATREVSYLARVHRPQGTREDSVTRRRPRVGRERCAWRRPAAELCRKHDRTPKSADASEVSTGRERSRPGPVMTPIRRRAAPRAAQVKGETHERRATTRLNLAGSSRMKRIVPAVALGRDEIGSAIQLASLGRGPPRGVHRCPLGGCGCIYHARPQHGAP